MDGIALDKSLIDTRKEFNYQVPDYDVMVKEMIEFLKIHDVFYKQYQIL